MYNSMPRNTFSNPAPFDMPQNEPYLYGTAARACGPAGQSLSMAVQSEQLSPTVGRDLRQSTSSVRIDPSLEMMFPVSTEFNRTDSQSYVANRQPSTNYRPGLPVRSDPIAQPDFVTNQRNSFGLPAQQGNSPWRRSFVHYDENAGVRSGSSVTHSDQFGPQGGLNGNAFFHPSDYATSSRPRAPHNFGRQMSDLQRPHSLQHQSPVVAHTYYPNTNAELHARDRGHVLLSTGSGSSGQVSSLIVRLPVALPADYTRFACPTTLSVRKFKKRGPYKKSAKQKLVEGEGESASVSRPTKILPAILMRNGSVSTEPFNPGHGIREPVPQLKSSGLYYGSLVEARQSVGKPNWMPPQNDDTIPATLHDKAVWVLALRNAMEDMSGYEDNASGRMRLRWLDLKWVPGQARKHNDTLTNPYYPRHWLEEKCWEIVDMCTRLHQRGPSIIQSCNPSFLETSFASKDLTFKQRMEMMIDCALRCKNRVTELIGGGMIEKYLITASKLVRETMVNRDNNVRRQVFIVDGRPQVDAGKKRRSRRPNTSKLTAQAEAMEQEVLSDPDIAETEQKMTAMARHDRTGPEETPPACGIVSSEDERLAATSTPVQVSKDKGKSKRKRGAVENEGGSIKRTRDLDGKSKAATARTLRSRKA